MNEAHWHLVVNHLPIIIPIIGLIIMIFGFILSSEILKRAAYSLFIFSGLTAFIAMSTGEGAEEFVEGLQGIDERFINLHEESAEIFSVLLYILGGLSIIGLWVNWRGKSFSKGFSIATMAFAIIVLFYANKTGTSGGEIRHTEIRNTNISNDETDSAPIIKDNKKDFEDMEEDERDGND